jgi:hypothetical protein
MVREGERPSETRKRKFCDHSCAASYGNAHAPKRRSRSEGTCERCGSTVKFKKRADGRHQTRKRFCTECFKIVKAEKFGVAPLESRTKGELFARCRSWQGARSMIQRDARKGYLASGAPRKCKRCGYELHFEVSHLRDVSTFPDSALVSEINDLMNLVALCPTHHWEFDNGHLSVKELQRGKAPSSGP